MVSHHPEFELYHDGECTEIDLVEMAIDRLSRNCQFGDSYANMQVMEKYMPKFPKGDNEKKQQVYLSYVHKYKDLVQKKFHACFPESIQWRKQ